jgi:hypothetical protein
LSRLDSAQHFSPEYPWALLERLIGIDNVTLCIGNQMPSGTGKTLPPSASFSACFRLPPRCKRIPADNKNNQQTCRNTNWSRFQFYTGLLSSYSVVLNDVFFRFGMSAVPLSRLASRDWLGMAILCQLRYLFRQS